MFGGKEKAAELLASKGLPVPASLLEDTICERYPFNAGRYFPAK